MKNGLKRWIAALLLLSIVSSFLIPATYADADAQGTITYDFELYKNPRFQADATSYTVDAEAGYIKSNIAGNQAYNGTNKVDAWFFANYKTNIDWGIETSKGYQTINAKNYMLRGTNNQGLRLRLDGVGQYASIRIHVPAAGKYSLSLIGGSNGNTVDVYAFPVTTAYSSGTLTSQAAIENAMTAENLLQANVAVSNNATSTLGNYEFAAEGDYLLVFQVKEAKENGVELRKLTLQPVAGTPEGTTETSATNATTTPETTTPETTAPAQNGDSFDFELYNNSLFASGIEDNSKYYKNEKAIKNAYPEQINWYLEGWTETIDINDLRFQKNDPAFRLPVGAGNWVAIRLNVATAGTYDVVVNSTLGWSANAWMLEAPDDKMTTAELEAAMDNDNRMGNIQVSASNPRCNIGQFTFAAGEYILILQAAGARIYLQNITLEAPGEEAPDTTAGTEATTVPTQTEAPTEPKLNAKCFDFELYNNSLFASGIEGNSKYYKNEKAIKNAYPEQINWYLEGWAEAIDINDLRFQKNDPAFRLSVGAGNWIAIRLNVATAGTYDVVVNSTLGWSANAWLLEAPADKMATADLEAAMNDDNRMGNIQVSASAPQCNIGKFTFVAGEYILILQASGDRMSLQNITLEEPGVVEKPAEDTRPEKVVADGFFDMELYNYKAFSSIEKGYQDYMRFVYPQQKQLYPESVNWILEAHSDSLAGSKKIRTINSGDASEGLRATTDDGVYGGWIALRLNNTKAGNYDLLINSRKGSYSGNVYLFAAPAETMTAAQIEGKMTKENLLGSISLTSEMESFNMGQHQFAAGELILVVQAAKTRIYLDSIAIVDHIVEVPKEPVDKITYDFNLAGMDEAFLNKRLDKWLDEAETIRVYKKVEQMYNADQIQWKYETKSQNGRNFTCRTGNLQLKATDNFVEVENCWTAVRLEAPGAGVYDVRIMNTTNSTAMANIYLIPAKTGVPMSAEEIQTAMTEDNRLIQGARFSGKGTTYLGEYEFGPEYEYIMVIELTRGTRFYIAQLQLTKDGLVADEKLPVGKSYSGIIYNFDLGDAYEGLLKPYGEYRYDIDKYYDQVQKLSRSGAINWSWYAGSFNLAALDENMVEYPDNSTRFMSGTGMRIYSRKNDWIAFKIKSPGSGDFTLELNYASCANSGTAAFYILPADTPTDEVWQATDPSNRVGKVELTHKDGTVTTAEDGYSKYIGYWNFEAGKEYILVIEAYEDSKFAENRSYINITNIAMHKGIIEYEEDTSDKAINPVIAAEAPVRVADAAGNFALFEIDGHDYYCTKLEGGTFLMYDLTTGELVDKQEMGGSRSRCMRLGPDGKVWISDWKYLVCYDPVTMTWERTKTFSPDGYKYNGFQYVTFDEEGNLYLTLSLNGHIVKYDPKARAFTDLGELRQDASYNASLIYKDGYLYITYLAHSVYNSIVKYNVATGQVEGICEFMEYAGSERAYNLGFLGENTLAVGVSTLNNEYHIAIDINTMELVDLGLPGSIARGVSEEINGKHYIVVQAYGLYEYDVATGLTNKVPGMPSVGGAGFRSGGQGAAGKSWIMMDGELCLVTNNTSGGFPRIINLDAKEYWEWTWLTSDVGGGSNIISFTNGAEGSGEIIAGSWNAHYAVTYNIYEGKVTNITDTAGQTDSILWYKDILYGGCYSATVLVELDRERNEYTQRFKLDHELTGQKRLLAMAAGDDRVFVGSVPDSNLNGGSITVYNTLNGSWQTHRNVVQDHSITDVAYSRGVVFLGSTQSGGDGAASAKTSAMIVAYDYEEMKPIATLDPRDYFPGLASPVRYICNLTADPNTEENGRLWATVSDILFCFTFDRETSTFHVQEVYSIQRTDYYDQSGWNRQQHQINFIVEENQLYVTMSPSFGGMRCITLEDWDAPIGSIKVVGNERIMNYCPEDFIIAQDNNMYFANGGDIMILPLNVTEEDWAIAGEVDEMILALDETVTLQSEAAIKTARSAYQNLTWKYRALVQKLELLQEAESDILECKIAAWEGKEITADDYPAMEELLETYKGLNERQQRYVKNYKELKAMHNTASNLYDARCAAAVQEKVDALKDLLPITSLEKEPAVVAVRTEFDALTGSQKLLVDTTILKEAEAQVAVLRAELIKQVEALIQAIPAEITLAAEPAIVAAREGVDKLYALERKQVSYSKLETAESKLRSLKNSVAKAEEVDSLIKAIGIVTLGDEQRIIAARQAYNQLTETARRFVTKLGKLQRAEFILAGLKTWMIPTFVVVGAGAAFCVVWFVPSLHSKVFKAKKKEEEPVETEN